MAFWGLEIKPGKAPTPLNLERRLVIKQAALSVTKSSPEPVVLSVSVKDSAGQTFVVCRLHEGKIEHCPLELPFTPEDQPMLHLKGAHAVHLTGFLEMEEEDELEEGEDMEDATATKVAPPKIANGALDADDDDDDDDEGEEEEDFEEGEEEEGEEEEGEEEEGEEEDDEMDELDDDDDDDDEGEEEEEEEVVVAPPKSKAAAKRPTPAPAAPPAKKAKAQPPAATPKAAPAAAPKASPAASAASPGGNSWTAAEDSKLQQALAKFGPDADNRWDKIAKHVGTRNKEQCKKRQKAVKSA